MCADLKLVAQNVVEKVKALYRDTCKRDQRSGRLDDITLVVKTLGQLLMRSQSTRAPYHHMHPHPQAYFAPTAPVTDKQFDFRGRDQFPPHHGNPAQQQQQQQASHSDEFPSSFFTRPSYNMHYRQEGPQGYYQPPPPPQHPQQPWRGEMARQPWEQGYHTLEDYGHQYSTTNPMYSTGGSYVPQPNPPTQAGPYNQPSQPLPHNQPPPLSQPMSQHPLPNPSKVGGGAEMGGEFHTGSKLEQLEQPPPRVQQSQSTFRYYRQLGVPNDHILSTDADEEMYGWSASNLSREYFDAYRQVLATRECIEMWFIKVIFLGAPRLGKTTVRRRLTGEINDIRSSGEGEQPSTGAIESGHSILIRNLSTTTALITPSEWLTAKNLTEEARMLIQLFYGHTIEKQTTLQDEAEKKNVSDSQVDHVLDTEEVPHSQKMELTPVLESPEPVLQPSNPSQHRSRSSHLPDVSEVADLFHEGLFREAAVPELWKDVKHVFKGTTYLKMEDTGGQPEFMDMLPALTIGPALYLLFCKLIDDLQSRYTVTYRSPSGESTTPVAVYLHCGRSPSFSSSQHFLLQILLRK